jgi:hypothetical protein
MTLAANIGVLAGIVFLGLEIRVNTDAVRSATYQAFKDSSFSFADSQIEHAAELAEICSVGRLEDLSVEQQLLWQGYRLKWLSIMESNYLQHRAGAMDDDLFETKTKGSVSAILARDIWLKTWETHSGAVVLPEFIEFMDNGIKEAQGSPQT